MLGIFNGKTIYCFTQGDSGGPLTVADFNGAHTLIGIVSQGVNFTGVNLTGSCGKDEYAIFTNVQSLMPWIESSIIEIGGMASCNFNFSALPSLGPNNRNSFVNNF